MTAASLLLSAAYVLFAALSLALAVIDVRSHRLPNTLVLPAYPVMLTLLAVACLFGADPTRLGAAVLGGLALFAFYLVLRLVSPAGMGGGDVKLAGVIGIMLGWVGWPTLAIGALAGFILGGLTGVVLLAARRATRRTRIPFGPFMIAGAWFALLAGPALSPMLLSTAP